MVIFLVAASCVTMSNHAFLSFFSSATGINRRIEDWKSTHLNVLDGRKPLVECISQVSNGWDSKTRFMIWFFQPPASKRYFQMHLLAEQFVFGGWWSRFPERGSQFLSDGTNVASYNLPTFFSAFHGYLVTFQEKPRMKRNANYVLRASSCRHQWPPKHYVPSSNSTLTWYERK